MNFVCIVFEIDDKMLTLSSMENLIVQCNHHRQFGLGSTLTKCLEITITDNLDWDQHGQNVLK